MFIHDEKRFGILQRHFSYLEGAGYVEPLRNIGDFKSERVSASDIEQRYAREKNLVNQVRFLFKVEGHGFEECPQTQAVARTAWVSIQLTLIG